MSAVHGEQTVTDGIHISYAWVFADAAARTATTDPLTNAPYSASDIGKFARQVDDNSIWMLTDTTPTWVGVSNNAAVDGLTSGRVVVVGSDGSLADDAGLTWDDSNSYLTVSGGSYSRFDVSGTNGASVRVIDTGGAVDEKNMTFINEAGVSKFRVEKDAGGVQTNDILVIDNSSGVISLGTSTPVAGAQLDVAGDIVVSDGAGNAKNTVSLYNYEIKYPVGYRRVYSKRIDTLLSTLPVLADISYTSNAQALLTVTYSAFGGGGAFYKACVSVIWNTGVPTLHGTTVLHTVGTPGISYVISGSSVQIQSTTAAGANETLTLEIDTIRDLTVVF